MVFAQPVRRSIRLSGFDYASANWYYVTICTQDRECFLGKINGGIISLNIVGVMVETWWRRLGEKFPWIRLDEYIIMPNHIHGIIHIVRANPRIRPYEQTAISTNNPQPITRLIKTPGENMVSPLPINNTYDGLGQIMSWFKRMTTNVYIQNVKENNWPHFNKRLWQRNYYEHVIRDENDLKRIRGYIHDNPMNWEKDKLHHP